MREEKNLRVQAPGGRGELGARGQEAAPGGGGGGFRGHPKGGAAGRGGGGVGGWGGGGGGWAGMGCSIGWGGGCGVGRELTYCRPDTGPWAGSFRCGPKLSHCQMGQN